MTVSKRKTYLYKSTIFLGTVLKMKRLCKACKMSNIESYHSRYPLLPQFRRLVVKNQPNCFNYCVPHDELYPL